MRPSKWLLFLIPAVTYGAATVPAAYDSARTMDAAQTVAEVDGKPISFSDLRNAAHAKLEQQDATYQLRRHQLDVEFARAQQTILDQELTSLVDERILDLEARARHTDAVTLLADVKTPPVTDAEVHTLYESRKIPGAPSFEAAEPELRQGLAERKTAAALDAFYGKLRVKYHVAKQLEPMREAVAGEGPTRGAADGAVTIVEFADFQCPYCRRLEPALNAVLKRYPEQVRLVFRQYPLTQIHDEALHAAQAAVCADKQGKFWPMHDAILSDTRPLGQASLLAIAKTVGLDDGQFQECVRSQEPNHVIKADVLAGDELSIGGTPALFINGRFFQGGLDEEKLNSVIREELARTSNPLPTRATASR